MSIGSGSSMPASLILVGAGKMGGAMLEGWLARGLDPRGVVALDPHASPALTALCQSTGARLNPPLLSIAKPEALVLAVKPQGFDSAAPGVAPLVGPGTLVVSIMAGKTIADISARLGASAVVRAMPNTPASVGRGVTGAVASDAVTAPQRQMASALLAAVGGVEWVATEDLIDAVTAVSGSGPAYVFYLVESLAAAGVEAGLPADVAMRLARATVEGSGELMFRDAATPAAQLRANVTSPGGTTAAALEVLMAPDGLSALMRRAVASAKRRAGELAG